MSIYAVGDIQGCHDAFARLLEHINFDPARDRLWLCGDLVNRGGHSLETLRLLHSIRKSVQVTLGNHDLHLLATDHQHPDSPCRNREFNRILEAPDRTRLIEWLARQPLARWHGDQQVLQVHAGVIPQWNAEQTIQRSREVTALLRSDKRGQFLERMYGYQPAKWKEQRKGWSRVRLISNILTRIRFCRANGRLALKLTGKPGTQAPGYQPWFKYRHRQTREVTMIFGHWAALGLRVRKRYIALDSGCVWGGKLTAVRMEDRKVFQVRGLRS